MAGDTICLSCGFPLRLRNRYVVNRPLGKGGFGATFLAADEGLPGYPPCVIKQLRPNSQSPSILKMARELFEREAYTLGKIGNHPQIPRLLDYFEETSNFYLIQEYIEGETLKQEYERRGKFNEIEIRKIIAEILPALGFIHQNGVIHRDVKPANIIRRKQDGQLVLIDFGAVSTQVNKIPGNDNDGDDPSGLLTNFAIGTPGFAPPEQMAMRPVFSSDLYAAAMCCLYLLTGRSPKDFGHDPYTGEINWRSQVQLSEHLNFIFDKMLQPSVAHRFRTAEEVLQAMESRAQPKPQILDDEPNTYQTSQNRISRVDAANPNPTGGFPAARKSRVQASLSGRSLSGNDITSGLQLTRGGATRGGIGRSGKELKGGRKVIVEYGQGKRNFANQDLAKASLASANLAGIVMSRSKLMETDFCQSDLTGASFQGSIMSNAKLNGTNLTRAKMQRAILSKADLGSASLVNADLRESKLQFAYLSKADLTGANLSNADLTGAYLKQANLRRANLCGANLKGAKVSEEQLSYAKTNWSTIRPDGSKRLF
ncbi:serine/threonine protein kinase with pentapeptide repeats [Thalassoporum mexicanum PCC 7367]|nr:serine/threonine-protein kinase [Pseudanabaena sp. PCC 7367]AFY68938.1 serine/threonine protein kinase with pentapeptide repeats [Pseudanabaena sp. PCC 7367]